MKVFSAPQKVTLNITNRCNLNCLYCAVSSSKNAAGDLTLQEWKDLIDELADIKVFHLLISGGEPFIRKDFYGILEQIFKYHFRLSINSNGTIFNDELLSLLAGSDRFDNIQVSLDGPDRAVHDRMRGKGSFDRTMKGIEALRRFDLPFSVFVVVCRNNMDHLDGIVELSAGLGVSQIAFSPLLPQGSALSVMGDLFLTFEEDQKVYSTLRRLKRDFPELVSGTLVNTIAWMDEMDKLDMPAGESVIPGLITSCGGSVSECSIRPEGWVIPCDRLWDYKVGNVRDESFRSIWRGSEGFTEFRKRYSRKMDFFEECQDCRYASVCKGGCPSIPYNTGRGIDGWDPLSCFKVFKGRKKSYV
jgi:SynChlorMet cassette radical SAM/SPASM protein ScmE